MNSFPSQTFVQNFSPSKIGSIIPTITKGVAAPKSSKFDTNALLGNLENKPSERDPLLKGVSGEANSTYDFREFLQAEDVDGYVAATFRLTIEQCLKEGYSVTGTNPELAASIAKQLKYIMKASSSSMYTLLENLTSGLSKFNNGFLVVTRREFPGSKYKKYRYRGKDVKPISGLFYTEPQHMTPVRENGRIKKWIYENSDIGSNSKEFKINDVYHVHWNRKGSDVFGTPWILPGLDDVRMLRRLEEFIQMLISKHLFPLYHYKIGNKENPAVTYQGGTSEVRQVEQLVGDLPQQGCIFTSHRHEIVAIDSDGAMDIDKYVEHFDKRALSSLGLSDVDIGRGNSSNRATAQVMNQTRVDRCIRIQKVITEFFNNEVIFSLLLELGLDPFDEANEVQLKFAPIDPTEQRARETHALLSFQGDAITHDELRVELRRRPFQSRTEWEGVHSNTIKRIQASIQQQADEAAQKLNNLVKNKTTPANKAAPNGAPKPKLAKNK